MKKVSYVLISLAGAGVIGVSAVGVASAASPNVGSSGISKSVFRQERLTAASQVLNTSVANIQSAIKDRTLKTLITSDGLTPKTFRQDERAKLVSDLEALGYTKDQITIAQQHRLIVHLRHRN